MSDYLIRSSEIVAKIIVVFLPKRYGEEKLNILKHRLKESGFHELTSHFLTDRGYELEINKDDYAVIILMRQEDEALLSKITSNFYKEHLKKKGEDDLI